MRVISGIRKGAKLITLDASTTRPTTDRIKEAMFNLLGQVTYGTALDLFAGSGSLGIEALSRGCDNCVFVENNHDAIKVIKSNLTKLRFEDQAQTIKQDANTFFQTSGQKFDFIFLDPPYANNYLNSTIEKCASILQDDGLIVVETEKNYPLIIPATLNVESDRNYGITRIIILGRN